MCVQNFIKIGGGVWIYISPSHTHQKNICLPIFVYIIAKVPGTRVTLQPAEHLLFFKQFSKMCPSAYRVSCPPGPDGGGGRDKTFTKTFLVQLGICVQNFIKIRAGFGFPVARQIPTDRQTNICTPILNI